MQPSAGSASTSSPSDAPDQDAGPGLPHTRTRRVHWIATILALGAVVAGAVALQPSDATATPETKAAPPARQVPAPDARAVAYPVECGQAPVDVVRHVSGDLNGDGRPETVAVVRCHSGTGTPPSGIFVIAPAGNPAGKHGAKPRVMSTFLKPSEGMSVQDFTLRGATVSATLVGYSSLEVPRCCPDLQRKVNWRWQRGKFVLKAMPVPGRT
ncbi:hypothetical protein [Streptomyces zagrosensis]|uniref:Secreted protein n=1 Tax=Streptomyces zagrosensis TaxID=1042984 RepID=A0A7W9QGZ5_9ACTN|nr:hypothetical protein [Streptomyces zagrosensis]MBB5938842.1 hypothetical protein [Streptomyces zagrosensis]